MTQTVALSENFGDLLDPRFRKIYTDEYEENLKKSMVPMIFGMETSTKDSERVSGVGGMSDVGAFNGQLDYDSVSQLYDKVFTFPEYAKGFKISRKLYDDDQSHTMDREPWQLAIAVARTREKLGAAIINGMFIGTDGPDNLSLCNAAHPYSPDDATTQSNVGSTALSATSIEATRIIGQTQIFTDRGELMNVDYDTILVPVNLQAQLWEIDKSEKKVDSDYNNRNFAQGRYKLAWWARMTDANNWLMIDSKLASKFLLWWDRITPEFERDRDFDTKMAKWSVYFRCCAGWAGWQPVYGHNVS